MSISENKDLHPSKKIVLIYMGIAVFCAILFLIYDQFSHGVRSPYMTWLFLWPLGFGVLPGILFWKIPKLPRPGTFSANLYHSGVAALTVSSLLRGIFEIAGTASVYQERLMTAGYVMILFSLIVYFGSQ